MPQRVGFADALSTRTPRHRHSQDIEDEHAMSTLQCVELAGWVLSSPEAPIILLHPPSPSSRDIRYRLRGGVR